MKRLSDDPAVRLAECRGESVPPAGGGVLAYHHEGLAYTVKPHSRAVELVDRAHVTRMQAELCARAGQIASLAGERDALKADLASAHAAKQAYGQNAIDLQSELTKARELIQSAKDSGGYFDQGDWDKIEEFLAHQSAPAAKCETCDGTGHDLNGGMNPTGGAADCLDCGGRGTGAKGGE